MKSEKIYTKSSYSKPIFLYFLEKIMITIILHIVDFFDSLEHGSQFRMRRRNENQRHSDHRGTNVNFMFKIYLSVQRTIPINITYIPI